MQVPYNLMLNYSFDSVPAKSCRRILFNHCDSSLAETGRFHVDIVFGMGSCTLLKYNNKFFCLTAKHVFQSNNIDFRNPNNESPFWVPIPTNRAPIRLAEYLFPAAGWDIGTLIVNQHWNYVDFSDIYLIEMFPPILEAVHHYIEIGAIINNILPPKLFFEGQLVSICGFPYSGNHFSYDNVPEGYTHLTQLQRTCVMGFCIRDGNGWAISLEHTEIEENTHELLNGISGGVVCTANIPNNPILWAGMAISASNTLIRFIPAYILYAAITRYLESPMITIDPASTLGRP